MKKHIGFWPAKKEESLKENEVEELDGLHFKFAFNAKRTNFVNLKSNSALLYNKGHNLLTSAFPPNNVK